MVKEMAFDADGLPVKPTDPAAVTIEVHTREPDGTIARTYLSRT